MRASGRDCAPSPSLSTDYYGFDASRPPFDDVRIRQAFGAAVDWRRIAFLGADDPATVATSMVPPGIPGRSDRDVLPAYDPDAARALLADAGFPGGSGFPVVTLLTSGAGHDEAIATELERELGRDHRPGGRWTSRTSSVGWAATRRPIWSLSWVADYPGRNDFLGVLLGSGASNNYGRWSSPRVRRRDRRRSRRRSPPMPRPPPTTAPRTSSGTRSRSCRSRYGSGWALAADGLLGAGQNGLGSLRFAGLAWAP